MSLKDFIDNRDYKLLPPNTLKYKHRILIGPDPKNHQKVITGIPIIHKVTDQLVAFVEINERKINIYYNANSFATTL